MATKVKSRTMLVLDDVVKDKQSGFLDELYQYVWDEKSGEPVKANDDVMDAWRYAVATRNWKLNNQESVDVDGQSKLLADHGLIDDDGWPDEDEDPWDEF